MASHRSPSRAAPRLLLLDHALDHGLYRPVEHWRELVGFEPDHVHVPSGVPLPEPGAHSHVILSGSESSIVEPAAWALRELEWVRQAAAAGVRLLGSCWGHQLIARALGGPECVRRAAIPELGWTEVERLGPADDLFPVRFASFVSHFDEVVAGSHPAMVCLGRSAHCDVQLMRWGELAVWGVQAHPEVPPETGRRFLESGVDRFPAHAALFREALAQPVRDDGFGAELARRFLLA
jgi:GMP synthase-like glutamine amidotransferase